MRHALAKTEESLGVVPSKHRWVCTCGITGPWLRDSELATKTILNHLNEVQPQHSQENKTMSNKPNTPSTRTTESPKLPTKPTAPAKETNGAPAGMSAAAAKSEEKRPRVRWQSVKNPAFWVRSFKDVTDAHGAPKDPWGETMVPAVRGAADPGRKAAKAERETKLLAMSAEEKLAFLKKEKETRKAAKEAKESAKVEALKAKIREELLADMAKGKTA